MRVQSAYLDEAARSFPEAMWSGMAAMPLMMSVRAAVRTHVATHAGDVTLAKAYLEAAISHLSPPPPVLASVGGFSGTGIRPMSHGSLTFPSSMSPSLRPMAGRTTRQT